MTATPMPLSPNPALVTREAVRRLPRWALLALCTAYLLPGLFGRDPWRSADLVAFAQMLSLAEGRSPWLAPMLGGISTHAAPLPHWIGAWAIQLGQGWLDPALAARLPFTALLALTLLAVWRATFHLASADAAQPLRLAFGGEPPRHDYAAALADGALLALIATLGLLQPGHETTPELAQLAAIACWQWALAAAATPRRPGDATPALHGRAGARIGLLCSLPALAACGAPTLAGLLVGGSMLLCWTPQRRALQPWLLASAVLAAIAAWPLHGWAWRIGGWPDIGDLVKLWAWFLWPTWLLGAWGVWRWRQQLLQWPLALPLLVLGLALLASAAMSGAQSALLLGLPGIAVLAAFALPTLRRSSAAAIDWFSVFAFTLVAALVWLYHLGMLTGTPAAALATARRLTPGFEPRASWLPLLLAAVATLAWAALVRWRIGRHAPVLWKSLVLAAGGVGLSWTLLMTLWLPWLDYARSNRPLVDALRPHLDLSSRACVAVPQGTPVLVAALEWHGRVRVDARSQSLDGSCSRVVIVWRQSADTPQPLHAELAAAGWHELARVRRPTERQEWTLVFARGAD
jgi:4-amino-4-deoxy-L-arabinose transferase-like glycosyltransferase